MGELTRFIFSWDKAQENGTIFCGWRMSDLLTKLLVEEVAQGCDQCFIGGDCTHNAASAALGLLALRPELSWDTAQEEGISFHGWTMDRLLIHILNEASERKCDRCHPRIAFWPAGCHHEAARQVLSIKRTIEHPIDCPNCRIIRERHSTEGDLEKRHETD